MAVRRSRHAVRHDHQRLAHVGGDRAHQREQPLQRVHVPRRHRCNLASINLTRFLNEDGSIDIEAYKHAIHITITAQEILVSNASYPTEKIAKNSEDFRPLGLGYANLGALLMARGVPYDSPQGRDLAACLTSIITGEAYAQSARIAREIGPFSGYAANRQPMLRVIGKHREAAYNIPTDNIEADLIGAARHAWDEAHELGAQHGYRNAQATVLAPTGTISFMLDCDTTGVEPDIALVKYKKLVGGGMLKMVNGTVPAALRRLGYGETAIADIIAYIDTNDTIEGAPTLARRTSPSSTARSSRRTASARSRGRATSG